MSASGRIVWKAIGASVTGASHVREGRICQDAISTVASDFNGQNPLIVALADGHGGARYFRSDVGAKLAVDSARYWLNELGKHEHAANLTTISRIAHEQLPSAIVNHWDEMVDIHFDSHPFTDQEQALAADGGSSHRVAYGATIVALLATPRFLVHLQLGDGDTLVLENDDTVVEPLPADPLLEGNMTTSLCQPDSKRHMRVKLRTLDAGESEATVEGGDPSLPRLIMLSTDGYANSFEPEEFPERLREYHRLIADGAASAIDAQLAGWLTRVSQKGSGDDISLALIYPDKALLSRSVAPAVAITDLVSERQAMQNAGPEVTPTATRSRRIVQLDRLRPLRVRIGAALLAGIIVVAAGLATMPASRHRIHDLLVRHLKSALEGASSTDGRASTESGGGHQLADPVTPDLNAAGAKPAGAGVGTAPSLPPASNETGSAQQPVSGTPEQPAAPPVTAIPPAEAPAQNGTTVAPPRSPHPADSDHSAVQRTRRTVTAAQHTVPGRRPVRANGLIRVTHAPAIPNKKKQPTKLAARRASVEQAAAAT